MPNFLKSFVHRLKMYFSHSLWATTPEHLEVFAWILRPVHKTFWETFDSFKFKIWGTCGLKKFQFMSAALGWPMSTKSFLIFITFLFHLFIYLINSSILYSINYFSFVVRISLLQFSFLLEKSNTTIRFLLGKKHLEP